MPQNRLTSHTAGPVQKLFYAERRNLFHALLHLFLPLGDNLFGSKIADFSGQLDLVAVDLSGVDDGQIISLEVHYFRESNIVSFDASIFDFGFTEIIFSFAGELFATLGEGVGVVLVADLRTEGGSPGAGKVGSKSCNSGCNGHDREQGQFLGDPDHFTSSNASYKRRMDCAIKGSTWQLHLYEAGCRQSAPPH